MTEDRNQSENTSAIDAGRESALSIRRGWWLAYALIFSAQVIAWTILVVLEEVGYGGHRRPTEIAIAIGLKVGTLIIASIAYTMILLEGVRSLMVISGYLQDKLDEKRRRDAARREAEEEQRKAEEEQRIAEAVAFAEKRAKEVIEKRMAESYNEAAAEAAKVATEAAKIATEAAKVVTDAAKATETAKAQGVSEAHQAWADWNRRRIEADELGDPFDEDPPEFPQQTGEPK